MQSMVYQNKNKSDSNNKFYYLFIIFCLFGEILSLQELNIGKMYLIIYIK